MIWMYGSGFVNLETLDGCISEQQDDAGLTACIRMYGSGLSGCKHLDVWIWRLWMDGSIDDLDGYIAEQQDDEDLSVVHLDVRI